VLRRAWSHQHLPIQYLVKRSLYQQFSNSFQDSERQNQRFWCFWNRLGVHWCAGAIIKLKAASLSAVYSLTGSDNPSKNQKRDDVVKKIIIYIYDKKIHKIYDLRDIWAAVHAERAQESAANRLVQGGALSALWCSNVSRHSKRWRKDGRSILRLETVSPIQLLEDVTAAKAEAKWWRDPIGYTRNKGNLWWQRLF
jgi:hypothetical protein